MMIWIDCWIFSKNTQSSKSSIITQPINRQQIQKPHKQTGYKQPLRLRMQIASIFEGVAFVATPI